MAKYPQGVSSYIPSFQAYESDLTSMGEMLSIKQDKYDQNWKKLNSIYSTLYFSPTTHSQSQRVKDQLRNEIDFNLRRVSGLDLSLDQNVQAAQQVFQPFYQNASLMYDMAATKNYKATKAKALSYQASTKAEEHGLWWQDGMLEMEYKLQDFQNTPYDQIQNSGFAQLTYTPYVDIGKMSEDIAKEFGDKIIPSTSADGLYEIETTNGPAALMQPLAQLYQFRMGNDPRVQAMYKTQAYVDRKNWSNGHADEYGGNPQAAEMAYLENEFKTLQGGVKKTNKKLQGNEKSFTQMQTLLESALKNGTAAPGAEKALNDIMSNKDITSALLNLSNLEKDMVTEGSSNGNTSTGKQVIFDGDINQLRGKVDILRANSLMMQDFDKAAFIYSQRNMKVTRKANEFALAEFKENLRAKNEKSLARDKFMVETGVATYDENGNIHEVKARNDWQSEGPVGGVTAGETNLLEFATTELESQWSQFKPGMSQGLDIATVVGIEGSAKAKDITKILNRGKYKMQDGTSVDKNKTPLTLTAIKNAIQDSPTQEAFEDQTGLDIGDLTTLNSKLLDLINNDETVTTLVDSKFQTEVDKNKVTSWKQESIKDNLLLKGIYAEKEWLAEATQNLLTRSSQSQGILRNAYYAVDHKTGALLGEEHYYKNALNEIEKNGSGATADWLRKYLADQRRYAKREAHLAQSANEQWEKGNYLGYAGDQFESLFNTYKDTDDFFGPDNIIGGILQEFAVADYDDVAEAWTNQLTNARNFKTAPPSSFGTGTGISSMPSSAIVTPSNQGARPTQDFYGHMSKVGIYEDYREVQGLINIGAELTQESPVIFSGVGSGSSVLDENINTTEHQKFAKAIWEMHGDRANFEKTDGFKVIVLPTTGVSGTKAGYTIMPNKEILDDLIPTGATDSDKDFYEKLKTSFLQNGATVISDRVNFDSYAFEASTTNPIEASLKRNADIQNNGLSEEIINIEPGYGMDFTYNKTSNQYAINHRYKSFNLESYLATGNLNTASVPIQLQSGQTLYTQFESYLTSTMVNTKASNLEKINLIRNLRKSNPNISNDEIRKIFNAYNFQYRL